MCAEGFALSAKRRVVKPEQVRLRRWRVIDYELAEWGLRRGMVYFVEGVKRSTAHSAAKRLSRRLGFKVIARPAYLENDDGTRITGYAFIRGDLGEFVRVELETEGGEEED